MTMLFNKLNKFYFPIASKPSADFFFRPPLRTEVYYKISNIFFNLSFYKISIILSNILLFIVIIFIFCILSFNNLVYCHDEGSLGDNSNPQLTVNINDIMNYLGSASAILAAGKASSLVLKTLPANQRLMGLGTIGGLSALSYSISEIYDYFKFVKKNHGINETNLLATKSDKLSEINNCFSSNNALSSGQNSFNISFNQTKLSVDSSEQTISSNLINNLLSKEQIPGSSNISNFGEFYINSSLENESSLLSLFKLMGIEHPYIQLEYLILLLLVIGFISFIWFSLNIFVLLYNKEVIKKIENKYIIKFLSISKKYNNYMLWFWGIVLLYSLLTSIFSVILLIGNASLFINNENVSLGFLIFSVLSNHNIKKDEGIENNKENYNNGGNVKEVEKNKEMFNHINPQFLIYRWSGDYYRLPPIIDSISFNKAIKDFLSSLSFQRNYIYYIEISAPLFVDAYETGKFLEGPLKLNLYSWFLVGNNDSDTDFDNIELNVSKKINEIVEEYEDDDLNQIYWDGPLYIKVLDINLSKPDELWKLQALDLSNLEPKSFNKLRSKTVEQYLAGSNFSILSLFNTYVKNNNILFKVKNVFNIWDNSKKRSYSTLRVIDNHSNPNKGVKYLNSFILDNSPLQFEKKIDERFKSTNPSVFIAKRWFSSKIGDKNYVDSDESFLNLYLKLNSGIKNPHKYDPNLFGNNGFFNLKYILDYENDLPTKQLNLEKSLKNLWAYEIKECLSNIKSISDDNKGFSIFMGTLHTLKDDFILLFNDKRIIGKKEYLKFISDLDSSVIISICLSKVLPFLISDKEENEASITSLCESIGARLYKEVIMTKFFDYLEDYKNNFDPSNPDKEPLNFKDYSLIFSHSKEDHIRCGLFILIFIGEKTELYNVDNMSLIMNDYIKSKRIISTGDLFDKIMNKLIIFESYEAPMVVPPVEWIIDGIPNNTDSSPHPFGGILENKPSTTIKQYGGYLLNNKENFEPLIIDSKESDGKTIIVNDRVIKMVNYMSSTPYKINTNLLDYLTTLILNNSLDGPSLGNKTIINNKEVENINSLIYNLELSTHPETRLLETYKNKLKKTQKNEEPTKGYDPDENCDIFVSERDVKNKISEIISHNSKFQYNRSILVMSLLFKNIDKIYFPLKLDWRGRIYVKGGSLNIQGGELARSLLLFAEGKVLDSNGLEALKIYCANSFGKDKLSKVERLKWVDENLDKILDLESKFWVTADEKFIALACSLELIEYFKDNNYKSSLPILIDATCSGLQHLSAMIQDVNLAEKVNLLESSKEVSPNDVYSLLIVPIKENIRRLVSISPEFSKLTQVNIIRSFIKIPIMTISYNVTPYGICEQLIKDKYRVVSTVKNTDPKPLSRLLKSSKGVKGIIQKGGYTDNYTNLYQALEPKKYGNVLLTKKELFKLSSVIYNSLFDTYPKLKDLVKYFNSMTNLLNMLNLPIIWVTPSGLYIEQKYVIFTTYDITNNVLSNRKTITLRKSTEDINPLKQKLSLVPNYTHSMDASNIILLYDALKDLDKKLDFLSIHDCFGAHANDINLLSYLVKNAFISIYNDNNFIESFHKINVACVGSIVPIINNEIKWKGKSYNIPTPPTVENLNLKYHLPKSLYFLN